MSVRFSFRILLLTSQQEITFRIRTFHHEFYKNCFGSEEVMELFFDEYINSKITLIEKLLKQFFCIFFNNTNKLKLIYFMPNLSHDVMNDF